ncbi:hypothetical protein X738_26945 [Mesorhizobium sp. LNHC209A00]|nr:hypothetical protein X738_26945 [Mesorhizobium sp. LNHC209A00]
MNDLAGFVDEARKISSPTDHAVAPNMTTKNFDAVDAVLQRTRAYYRL